MAEGALASLHLGSVCVAEYVDGSGLDPGLTPRPYLHPIRTLSGRLVTDARPADHPWHLGLSVAVPDVDGWNFWGGPTYRRDSGYLWRDDHGHIEHAGFATRRPDGVEERLRWLRSDGRPVLTEQRRLRARLVDPGWELEVTTSLKNVAGHPLALGSPASNGRAGAGYGGLFWRLPPGEPTVRTPDGQGEAAVHGSFASWLVWSDQVGSFTLALTGTDAATRADPWFVRVREYPGIGSQVAASVPRLLPPDGSVTRGLRALVADGLLDDGVVEQWAAAVS